MPPVKIKTRPAIFILERKDFREYPYGRHVDAIETIEMTDDQIEEPVRNEYVVEEIEEMYQNDDLNIYEEIDSPLKSEADDLLEIDEAAIPDEGIAEIPEEEIEELPEEEIEEIPGEEIAEIPEEEIAVSFENILNNDVVLKQENDVIDDVEVDELEVEPPPKPVKAKKPKIKIHPQLDDEPVIPPPKLTKAKKSLDELKMLRQERKKKAIEKIKSETRREVVASAKEKLKEIMKRHKHIADELLEDTILKKQNTTEEIDGRGDIPEMETVIEQERIVETEIPHHEEELGSILQINETFNSSNENVDSIVEEVISRLIDRKIYDDKTKPEDIKAEDRQIIQKIVEEVLSERMNYTRTS